MPDAPLVFYDGVCGLCNRTVRWLIRHDRNRLLRYAPLQSELARKLPPGLIPAGTPETIIFSDRNRHYTRSEAVIRIFMRMGGLYKLSAACYIIPRPLRDAMYDWIARNRYRWFGRHDACPLPSPEERDLFIY